MDLQQSIEWLHEMGATIHFYTCSGFDEIAIRFYRHCNGADPVEYSRSGYPNPASAIVALCNELAPKGRVELLHLTPYQPIPTGESDDHAATSDH